MNFLTKKNLGLISAALGILVIIFLFLPYLAVSLGMFGTVTMNAFNCIQGGFIYGLFVIITLLAAIATAGGGLLVFKDNALGELIIKFTPWIIFISQIVLMIKIWADGGGLGAGIIFNIIFAILLDVAAVMMKKA